MNIPHTPTGGGYHLGKMTNFLYQLGDSYTGNVLKPAHHTIHIAMTIISLDLFKYQYIIY